VVGCVEGRHEDFDEVLLEGAAVGAGKGLTSPLILSEEVPVAFVLEILFVIASNEGTFVGDGEGLSLSLITPEVELVAFVLEMFFAIILSILKGADVGFGEGLVVCVLETLFVIVLSILEGADVGAGEGLVMFKTDEFDEDSFRNNIVLSSCSSSE
jgi:hypothetical protein